MSRDKHAQRALVRTAGLPWATVSFVLLSVAPANADSPITLKGGATTSQTELDAPGMTLGGSLAGPRWRPLSGLLVAPQLEFLLARRHTGLVSTAEDSSYTLDFLEVPLLLRAELALGSRSFYAMAGGYVSLLLRADETNSQGLRSPASMAHHYDLGLLAAGGLTLASSPWGAVFAELRYQQGYLNLLPESEHKHRAVSLLVGYGLGTSDASKLTASSRKRRLTLKGGLVATRFQSPDVAASSFVPGFAFGGALSPVSFGSWIALAPQLELAFVHRGEHHGVIPAGSLILDDIEASARVRAEVTAAGIGLFGSAGLYGSVVVRAHQNLDGAILSMHSAVRPMDVGWLASVGTQFATFGEATLLVEVQLQRSLMSRFSNSDDAATQTFTPATQESLFLVGGFRYGPPNAPSRRTVESEPDVLYSANDQGEESAQRSGRTVSIRMARLSDRWLQDLNFYKIEPSHRDGTYGYQVTYIISGWKNKEKKETKVLFWKRAEIDIDESNPSRYTGVRVPLKDGQLVLPTRITSESLPDVHHWILELDKFYVAQANGAIEAMEGFMVIAELGGGKASLRKTKPRGASRPNVNSSARASTSRGTQAVQITEKAKKWWPRISAVAPDWATKGAHIHVNGVELAVRPAQGGRILFKPVFSNQNSQAVNKGISIATRALQDVGFRQRLFNASSRALYMIKGGKSAELRFLMHALESIGL